MMQNNADNH